MKEFETGNIDSSKSAPFSKISIDWLRDSYKEIVSNTLKAFTDIESHDTAGRPVILHGCIIDATTLTDVIHTSGAIYFNGEIYEVDEVTAGNGYDISVSNQLHWHLSKTYLESDPVVFDDGSNQNVHANRKAILVFGDEAGSLSGNSESRFDNIHRVEFKESVSINNDLNIRSNDRYILKKTKVLKIGDWNMDADSEVTIAHGITDEEKIISVNAMIRPDAGAASYTFISFEGNSQTGGNGGIIEIYGTNIVLRRTNSANSGFFDSSSYDSTSYNRGYVYIEYYD